MIEKLQRIKQKNLFVLILFSFLLLSGIKGYSQVSNGLAINWDQEVGCQTYGYDDKKRLFIEDIEESECIRFCELSSVNYTLTNLPAGATTTWSAGGGVVANATGSSCNVNWGAVGTGSLTFTITTGSTIITKTLCIEKILTPTALFEIAPLGQYLPYQEIVLCKDQAVNFINLSTTNNGTSIVSYHWEFKNISTNNVTYSAAFQPSQVFTEDGEYSAILTVTNECNCSSVYQLDFFVKHTGFEISCPTVICEGQSAIYSLPAEAAEMCHEFNWSVQGGQVLSQSHGNVEVLWDAVDQSGFGYVTFDPTGCDLDCGSPTTIKVPVIQTHGTIQGPQELCLKEQGRYKLPQWPTTDIQWEIVGNVGNSLAEVILTDQRNEVVINPLTTGLLVLRATYMNTLLHCGGEAELQIYVSEPIEIEGPDHVCQFEQATYTNSAAIPVNWTLTTTTGAYVHSADMLTDFTYHFTQAGIYILTAQRNGYCVPKQKIITVIPRPFSPAGVLGDLEVCPNSPYTYEVLSPNPSSDYYWEVTNGTISGPDTGNQVNITFNGTFPATIKVYQKTINPISCYSKPKTITVNQLSVNAAISSNFSAVCANSLASYQAVQTGTSTLHTDGDTYTWSISNPTLGSISNGQGTNSVDVTWNNVTTITTVDLVVTIGKCTLAPAPQFVKQITLYPKAEIAIAASNNPVCAGSLYPVTFTVSSANGVPLGPTDVVTWNLGSGTFTTAPGVFTHSTTFNNNSTTNIGQVVTAFIANANGCGQTNTASVTVTVLPNPPAIATLTSSANAFCNAAEINASITVSSNTTGVSFEWYKNGVALYPAQIGAILYVTPSMGFGTYTFRATNPNGCVRESNPIVIAQICPSTEECAIAATISNTSYLSACGQITFQGTASGSPLNQEWLVVGPGAANYSINGMVLTGEPGNYKIIHKVTYPCAQGGTGYITNITDVVIPYEPDFSYVVECDDNNNTFNVNFIDNSNFFALVGNQQIRFYYKLSNAPAFTGPVTYDPSLSVFEMQNLPVGNYIFKLEIEGTYPGTPTIVCSKQYTVPLQGIDPFMDIIVNEGTQVQCHDTPVSFALNPSPPPGSTVEWNFGDGATNTLLSPARVFSPSVIPYNVTVTVTNPYGCSRILDVPVTIPEECFFGDIVATPSNATVCQGQSVTLTYVPNNDNCSVATYTWMKGNQPVVGAPNSPQLTVTTSDFYWVKVESSNGCVYNSPTQIKPVFKVLPTVKLIGNTIFCENEAVVMKVNTNATAIQWYINGSSYPQFNNLTEAVFSGLSPNTYMVTVVVTSAQGCQNSASQNITVNEAIQQVDIQAEIGCEPYYHVNLTATASNGINVSYNWSNGQTGSSITVYDGGPYEVTASVGGCSVSAQIDVPKNPENYIWIFPTGCYSDCSTTSNYLIGPSLPLEEWSWNVDGQSDAAGSQSFTDDYTLTQSASYTLTINTGKCSLESGTLEYTRKDCEKCKIKYIDVKDIQPNHTLYCSFTFTLVIYSDLAMPYQVTLSEDTNQVLLLPSSFTLQPGQNIVPVTVIPQSPFNGGILTWFLQGTILTEEGYINCIYDFPVTVPACPESYSNEGEKNGGALLGGMSDFSMYPNPAATQVTVAHASQLTGATVEIFDLTGRSIAKKAVSSSATAVTLTIDSYPAGMYMVVVRKEGNVLWQQKLIIK
ncbi:T9SS type A sorting domain-containing protein [Flavobacterium sp.]|uniref:T9SS type A sorting domain-containing protein n=1 Tax=Flavobacterium sp. TaxID=239 RepID=UPI0028BD42DD|nr:T9SS type A sorting domain-containing protein [Flavobacterium sp.]